MDSVIKKLLKQNKKHFYSGKLKKIETLLKLFSYSLSMKLLLSQIIILRKPYNKGNPELEMFKAKTIRHLTYFKVDFNDTPDILSGLVFER